MFSRVVGSLRLRQENRESLPAGNEGIEISDFVDNLQRLLQQLSHLLDLPAATGHVWRLAHHLTHRTVFVQLRHELILQVFWQSNNGTDKERWELGASLPEKEKITRF